MGRAVGLSDARAALMALAQERGAGKSFCPSEAARRLSADWRPLMPLIRKAAAELQSAGALQATQKGQPVHPERARGPIRLTLASGPARPLP
ncbi:DUF3253 domain-containing protein [Roseibaca calidilacus]|uniref:DUF3253 domain-containing protein n=1 Tax=Roseibaca calidilacus TaxID=1666912 RepID=A0ABP2BZF0_9RHOB|nr:DUF3253 domain-containing protein [Roseibaca calidilacus]CUX82947.1 Protein of unknown function (DUF3253) [Roseibaca calidilacus]